MEKDNEKTTTIGVSVSTKKLLEKLKIHPNQSFDEVIMKIVKLYKEKNEFESEDEVAVEEDEQI